MNPDWCGVCTHGRCRFCSKWVSISKKGILRKHICRTGRRSHGALVSQRDHKHAVQS